MSRSSDSNRAGNRWAVRIIPFLIVCLFTVGTYAVVGRLCVDYLYKQKRQPGLVTAFLVLYFLFFFLTAAAYLRTFFTVQRDPGLVPLPPDTVAEREAIEKTRKKSGKRRDRDVEERAWVSPDLNPDSPGLEQFYSKDVFVCEGDGRPKWCSECRRWKPDRAHHSSELGRCVRKMDHFCPWVGGMVSETSFNFFAQFTFYCTLFAAVCLAIGAYCLQQRHNDGDPLDGWMVAVVVMACLFGSFACGMSLTSLRFILTNTTNIDMMRRSQTLTLAVRIPRATPPTDKYPVIVYPLRTPPPPGSEGYYYHQRNPTGPVSVRDQQAERKFAILRTQPRENPWNLGFCENWRSVMGNNVVEWMLPVRHSPCCSHDSMQSDYTYGPLVSKLRKRYGVPDLNNAGANGNAIEMHDRGPARS